jgi:hypothetical protein
MSRGSEKLATIHVTKLTPRSWGQLGPLTCVEYSDTFEKPSTFSSHPIREYAAGPQAARERRDSGARGRVSTTFYECL